MLMLYIYIVYKGQEEEGDRGGIVRSGLFAKLRIVTSACIHGGEKKENTVRMERKNVSARTKCQWIRD